MRKAFPRSKKILNFFAAKKRVHIGAHQFQFDLACKCDNSSPFFVPKIKSWFYWRKHLKTLQLLNNTIMYWIMSLDSVWTLSAALWSIMEFYILKKTSNTDIFVKQSVVN